MTVLRSGIDSPWNLFREGDVRIVVSGRSIPPPLPQREGRSRRKDGGPHVVK